MTTAFSFRFAALPLALVLVLGCNGSDGDDDEVTDDVITDGGGDDDDGGDLPRTGQDGMCDHAIECGSTYYADAQECIDAGTNYWGECRQAELDAFGDCMIEMDCADWNPDAYNPGSTPCADLYGDLATSECD